MKYICFLFCFSLSILQAQPQNIHFDTLNVFEDTVYYNFRFSMDTLLRAHITDSNHVALQRVKIPYCNPSNPNIKFGIKNQYINEFRSKNWLFVGKLIEKEKVGLWKIYVRFYYPEENNSKPLQFWGYMDFNQKNFDKDCMTLTIYKNNKLCWTLETKNRRIESCYRHFIFFNKSIEIRDKIEIRKIPNTIRECILFILSSV